MKKPLTKKVGDGKLYNDNYMYTDLGIKGNQFYFITDSNNVIYNYGTRTNGKSSYNEAQLLPYGGSKAYNVYGYDENGYDNKGYKTDGYNDAGYDRDGYDKNGYDVKGKTQNGSHIRSGVGYITVPKSYINKKQ